MTWLAVFMIGGCGFVTGGAGVLGYMLPALRQVERENRRLRHANGRLLVEVGRAYVAGAES